MWSLIWGLVAVVTTYLSGIENINPNFVSTIINNFSGFSPYLAPSPGNVYMIVEKVSGKAITLADDTPLLQPVKDNSDGYSYWKCVEVNNYYGFLNLRSGTYLGHNGFMVMRASADTMQAWEAFTPIWHANGGYQLLTPYWHDSLWAVDVAENGRSLHRRKNGNTLWRFVKVGEH